MTGVAIVGAAETTELGVIPNLSELQLHADAALNAFADTGLNAREIDGFATAGFRPTEVAQYLGLRPRWVDGTSVGGCSFMVHVRHAVAAIQAGHCSTVLITHGESGRSRVGKSGFAPAPASFGGQFEAPFGVVGPPTMFTIPVLRYMKDFGLTHERHKRASLPVQVVHIEIVEVSDIEMSDAQPGECQQVRATNAAQPCNGNTGFL